MLICQYVLIVVRILPNLPINCILKLITTAFKDWGPIKEQFWRGFLRLSGRVVLPATSLSLDWLNWAEKQMDANGQSFHSEAKRVCLKMEYTPNEIAI